jgi:hypothetical protein
MQLKLTSIAIALAFAFAGAAQAQTPAPATKPDAKRTEQSAAQGASDRKMKDAEEERIEAAAKADKAKCDGMKANAKDICMAEAKAKEKVAKAELDAKHDPSQKNQRKVAETRADAEHDVAKAKCGLMKGDEKNACEKQAKAKHDQAKAGIKKQYAARDDKPARSATSGASSGGAAGGTAK